MTPSMRTTRSAGAFAMVACGSRRRVRCVADGRARNPTSPSTAAMHPIVGTITGSTAAAYVSCAPASIRQLALQLKGDDATPRSGSTSRVAADLAEPRLLGAARRFSGCCR